MEKENTNIEIKTIIPFGPIVLHTKVPMYIIDNYNDYCDKIIADEKKLKVQDHSHNLAGNVKSEFRIDKEFIEKEKNMHGVINAVAKKMLSAEARGPEDVISLSYLVNNPIGEMSIDIEDITGAQILSMWAVSQWAGDFNPLHVHSGDLSGVIYLKIPEGRDEEYAKEDHHPSVGDIQWIAGTPQAFNRNNLKVKPHVGDMFVFPAWLHHTAYPFRTPNQERRSISFNLVYTNNKSKMGEYVK
jgi:hypothetical protein|tara:strand:- start:183 stop:911 length:729 start_codon:yes stop_codon:yes gene_type:complete